MKQHQINGRFEDSRIFVEGTTVPFSFQAVLDGHWEFYHDDDCGAVLDPDTKICAACGWRPDLQSMGARRVK